MAVTVLCQDRIRAESDVSLCQGLHSGPLFKEVPTGGEARRFEAGPTPHRLHRLQRFWSERGEKCTNKVNS